MLFKTLIIASVSSSLAQPYGNGYNHGYGSDYNMNYIRSQQNTLSRRACSIDEYGKRECFTPEPAGKLNEPIRKNCRPGSCWKTPNGLEVCDKSEVCELVQPKEPTRKNCRPGSCWKTSNGQEVCDRSEVCELVEPEY